MDEVSKEARNDWDPIYKLLLVAFSTCSSRAVLAPEDHQLIIVVRFLEYALLVFLASGETGWMEMGTISPGRVGGGGGIPSGISGGWAAWRVYQPSDSKKTKQVAECIV